MPENKMLIILRYREESRRDETVQVLSQLPLPERFRAEIHCVKESSGHLAAIYNHIVKSSNAAFTMYASDHIDKVLHMLWKKVTDTFIHLPNTGILGLLGSELPISGNPSHGKKIYGRYDLLSGESTTEISHGENPIFYQKVQVIDDGFFVTSRYIPWDESVDDDFLVAAQCCRFRQKGLDIIVPMQNTAWLTYRENRCMYERTLNGQESFLKSYQEMIQPKVSILIPAYNQPTFFREALESALAQDYGNIEIIVGDDSTNDDVRNVIQPYLKRHTNITYHSNDTPSGGYGLKNMMFLLNHCHGEYVNFLLHDDLFYPAKIRRMMEFYSQDLNGEIGFVTSERNFIDEEGKALRKANFWVPRRDTVLNGKDLGKRALWSISNFVGELSTMLFRKKSLQSTAQPGLFSIGHYCGVEDRSMGDISTILEVCRQDLKCGYLADCLGAFRIHEGQNTWKPDIVVTAILDWMNLIVLSWLNKTYIHTMDEFRSYCDRWRRMQRKNMERISAPKEQLSGTGMERYTIAQQLFDAIDAQKYENVIQIAEKYMRDSAELQSL